MMEVFHKNRYYKKQLSKLSQYISSNQIQKNNLDEKNFINLLGRLFEVETYTRWDGINMMEIERFNIIRIKDDLKCKYNIIDQESAKSKLYQMSYKGMQNDYEQFLGFWRGNPSFNIKELSREGYKLFKISKTFAYTFYSQLEEKGFLGWDISESIQIVRLSYICGYIEQNTAEDIIKELAVRASQAFDSWEEYALSLIAGAAYFMNKLSRDKKRTRQFFDKIFKEVEGIFENKGVNSWSSYNWLKLDKSIEKSNL